MAAWMGAPLWMAICGAILFSFTTFALVTQPSLRRMS